MRRSSPRAISQGLGGVADFSQEFGDAGPMGRVPGSGERIACSPGPEAAQGNAGNRELLGSAQGRRKGGGVEFGKLALGFIEAPDQEQAPDFERPRMCGVQTVVVLIQRRARRLERFDGKGEVARGERNLGLGHHATSPRDGLSRTEGARRTFQ